MKVFNLEEFPFAEFGLDPVRKVRLFLSQQTIGRQRCSIVLSSVSSGGSSEGYVHNGSDECIYILILEANLLLTANNTM